MALKLVTPAATDPVTLAEAKAHMRVDHDDDDRLIELLISAATNNAERFMGRALVEQTWDFYFDKFVDGPIELPMPPLIGIDGLFYRGSDGFDVEVPAPTYAADDASEPARIFLADGASWPAITSATNVARVRFTAGYPDNDDSPPALNVPPDIKVAILMMTATLYENRETIVIGQTATMIPWSAEQLLRRHKVHLSMA